MSVNPQGNHTASMSQPPPDALADPGAARDATAALMAEVSAERTVTGMEVGAERDGIAHLDLGDVRLSVALCETPFCSMAPFHYYGPVAGKPMPASRQTLVEIIAAHKQVAK